MKERTLVGIVMAAGESKRFGKPKQLLPFNQTTLLGQVVHNANGSRLDSVIVVLGRASDHVRHSIDFGRAVVVDNGAYSTGCASTLLAGLDAAGDPDAVMLLLGDQPGVRTTYIDQAAEAWREQGTWGAIGVYRDQRGHPFIFGSEAFEDLRLLHGDKAIWKLLDRHTERFLEVGIEADLPRDVDTPEDYERLLAD